MASYKKKKSPRNASRGVAFGGRSMNTVARMMGFMLMVYVLFVCLPAGAMAHGNAVFSPSTKPLAIARDVAQDAATPASRTRNVEINAELLFPADRAQGPEVAADGLQFNLFDDVIIRVTPKGLEKYLQDNTTVFVGINDDATGGTTRMSMTNGTLYGIVRTSTGILYEIIHLDGGTYQIRELDQKNYPKEHGVLVMPPSQPTAQDPAQQTPLADDGSIIDIMIAYTTSAKNAVGGKAAMESRIALAMSETNQGFANSGVIQRYRLVHTVEVSYSATGGFLTALYDVTNTADGDMDELHALRDQYGADIVSLFINDSSSCGIAWVMGSASTGFAPNAFNVVHYSCATGYFSFGHECGHNQGARHDRANNSGTPIYPYAFGYQQTNASPTYRTIMAYNCSPSCTRVNYWSNPEVSFRSQPTGVSYISDPNNSADNRMTLNNTRNVTANFRQSVSKMQPPIPVLDMLIGD